MTEYLKYKKKNGEDLTDSEINEYYNIISLKFNDSDFKEEKARPFKRGELKSGLDIEYFNGKKGINALCEIKRDQKELGFLENLDREENYQISLAIYSDSSEAKVLRGSLEAILDDCKELEKVN